MWMKTADCRIKLKTAPKSILFHQKKMRATSFCHNRRLWNFQLPNRIVIKSCLILIERRIIWKEKVGLGLIKMINLELSQNQHIFLSLFNFLIVISSGKEQSFKTTLNLQLQLLKSFVHGIQPVSILQTEGWVDCIYLQTVCIKRTLINTLLCNYTNPLLASVNI